ncbi:unnamed protein product [Bursaphelenchus okinawaensis]|uniref:BHLH domain-containing protein n=1 Tax=Bursaphelenchus okinawaensis TaxID=465554 RepID=A0A811KPH5_9BILA|nr:unnamed protein product [Bursaphelenchus okinawaensis]CAG9107998.1 unnamed protein product [Bursaphelenchus okinawaensis]
MDKKRAENAVFCQIRCKTNNLKKNKLIQADDPIWPATKNRMTAQESETSPRSNHSEKRNRSHANLRERCRMKKINHGFDLLRNCLPDTENDPKMSKVKTLRRAIDYIRRLQSNLEGSGPEIDFKIRQNNYLDCSQSDSSSNEQ